MTPTMKLYFLLYFILLSQINCLLEKKRPPSIYSSPKPIIYFKGDKTNERIELACSAAGEPKPQYTWKKNGKKLDHYGSDHITILHGIGTIIINEPTIDDEGYYQCFASNNYGTSVSILAHLQKAMLDTFPSVIEPRRHTPTVGYSLTLNCNVPKSIPSDVSIMWAKSTRSRTGSASSSDDMNMIQASSRVTKDLEGNLHFTNILESDRTPPGVVYMCMVLNTHLRSMVQGDDQTIEPQKAGTDVSIPVEKMWMSPSHILALKGKSLRIKCIFSGNPTPKVAWNRKGKDATLFDGISIQSFGMELIIDKVDFLHAGEYECHGVNEATHVKQTQKFTVSVEASPYWMESPKSMVVGVEENAAFACNSAGIPEPVVKWYINGVPIQDAIDNPRRSVFTRRIRYTNVTESDQEVIQCNSTNKHGYIWADMFLSIIDGSQMSIDATVTELRSHANHLYSNFFVTVMAFFPILTFVQFSNKVQRFLHSI